MGALEILQLISIIIPLLDNSVNLVDKMIVHIDGWTDESIPAVAELKAHIVATREKMDQLKEQVNAEIERVKNGE